MSATPTAGLRAGSPAGGPVGVPRPLRLAFWCSGIALAANVGAALLLGLGIGDAGLLELTRKALMWALATPIAVALVLIGALRHTVGRWHVAALVLCALGDGLGAATAITIVLLGLFLAGHLVYLAALWPTRRRSLAWSWAAPGYAFVALLAGTVIAANAGPLAVPVLVYALVLAGLAAFAAIDTPGLVGGLLLLATDLIQGFGLFVLEMPDALRAFAVLIPYAAAQALLALSLQQRLRLGVADT